MSKKIYAFIDAQNLYLGVKNQGWEIDYRKLRLYLRNKYKVEKAFLFIGFDGQNQQLYTSLQKAGFIIVFKSAISYLKNGKRTQKGNVDAELVLHAAAVEFNNYDQAIIISGDGDFACLIDWLSKRQKFLALIAPNQHYSSLLKKFQNQIILISALKNNLKMNKIKTSTRGRSKP